MPMTGSYGRVTPRLRPAGAPEIDARHPAGRNRSAAPRSCGSPCASLRPARLRTTPDILPVVTAPPRFAPCRARVEADRVLERVGGGQDPVLAERRPGDLEA